MELVIVTLGLDIWSVTGFVAMGVFTLILFVLYIIANEWPDTKKRLEKKEKNDST